jgi:hypothetical protein
MLNPSEEQVNEIDKHTMILQQSESEMDTNERASIELFKETVQYERCCSFLNHENYTNLSEAGKQAYDESHANQVSASSMTREEVDFHRERRRQLERDWSRKAEGKGKKEFDPDNATLMISNLAEESLAPLHDMTCVGVVTCSAKSISCEKEDFLDLQMSREEDESNVEYELRGVGGVSRIAGKGIIVIYAKDSDGKLKAIIEPKGVYLENPPAKFRILGQQKMKQNGIVLIQDYDDDGTDVLKCKRGGTILPLEEGGGILLLRTFQFRPNKQMQEQLRSYIRSLILDNKCLPHVIDLDETVKGNGTVLLMNEAKLKKENYERLLHWRFGHASSKVLQAMEMIEGTHLNEDYLLLLQQS